MVEVFGPLSARPPTPPRTTTRPLSEKENIQESPAAAQTPRDNPLSTSLPNGASSNRQSKRVNFSPWTRYIKPPSFTDPTATPESELKALPPSNECKPAKSILKQTSSPVATNSPTVVTQTPESFAMLLESITQQLAGESPSSRLDAYMQFFGALRAYDNLPTGTEIVDRLGLITQFIQRDVGKGFESGEPLQSSLVVQALKLANSLLWASDVAPHLPDEFKGFLIEQSINGLQDSKVPKSLLVHYLSILTAPNLHSKVMTSSRLARLLPLLINVTERTGGNTIISQRLMIYSRIMNHSKQLFVSHSHAWMDHLVTACLHHMKDIRLKAISLGFQISNAYGPNPLLSKSIYDIFDRPMDNDNGRKLAAEICERMLRMMSDPDSGVHVPQIWSVMILLLRNKRVSIDHWEHFREFVLVLQRCFNCSESMIRAQAIIAWNRFVFVASPAETTNLALLKMLGKPIISQFERKKEKQNATPSGIVWSSYHNLLYYAFRPSVPYHHLDTVWEEYIALPSAVSNPVPTLGTRLAYVLSNMFWSPQMRVWTANKANETHKLAPEELPTLDPKWLRSRITRVLKVLEAIFRSSVWANEIEKSKIAITWVNLARALSHASSKEITPSPDSMQAVAHVLSLLQRLWKAGPTSLNAAEDSSMDKFFDRFRFLTTTVICSLGIIPFTEKLFVKTADETFQAASTPTHRHPRTSANVDSPIAHLLRLISEVPGVSEPTPAYRRLVHDTLQAACNGRNARGSRLELLRQCAELYPNGKIDRPGPSNFAGIVWQSTAQLAADTLRSYPVESARARDGSAARDYENSVKVLSAGLKFANACQDWDKLADSLVRVIKTEKSDREITSAVVEPLAQSMMALDVQETYLPLSSLLNHSLSITYSHQGAESDNPTKTKVSPPSKLWELLNSALHESYEKFSPVENAGIADFLEALTSFLGSGVVAFRYATLESLQHSLALWLKDDLRKINLESGVESRILTAYRALSSAVLNILQSSSPQDTNCVYKQQRLICAGLESSHMSVAKRFVDFWDPTLGQQKSLPCPEPVSRALEILESRIKQQKPTEEEPQAISENGPVETSKQAVDRAEMHEKSRIAFILDNTRDPSGPDTFDSSPITKDSAPLPASLEQPSNLQPQSPAIDDTPEQISNGDAQIPLPTVGEPKQRSEVFSMIESLRSSSPANTPREFGFMTPPHLRNLRNPDRGTPQTPTLAAVGNDNEDGFLGSSPTPGTRDRSHAVRSGLPQSWTVSTEGQIDPPSSPPDVPSQSQDANDGSGSQNGSASKSKGSASKKSKRTSTSNNKKSKKAQSLQKDPFKHPRFNQREGSPLIKRLRSFSSKTPALVSSPRRENVERSPVKDSSANTTPKNSTPSSSKKPSRSKSSAKKKTIDLTGDVPKIDFGLDDTIADSFSDDMETQLASQLEQDLESAVDSNVRSDSQALETQSQPPVTKKRKREVNEFMTPTNKERRRSSRFSFHKEEPILDDPETLISSRSGRSKKQPPSAANEQALASSPVESNPKKRRRQSKGETNDVEVANSTNTEQQIAPSPAEGSSKKRRQSKASSKSTKEPKSMDVEKDKPEAQPTSQNTEVSSPKQKLSESSDAHSTGEGQTSPQSSALSSSQKRRSSRLSGHVAPVSTDELPAPTKPSSSRSRKQNAKEQEPQPNASLTETPIDVAGETMAQSTQENQPGDEEASTERRTEKPKATPSSQSRGQDISQAEDVPMPDADTNVGTTPVAAIETVKQTEKQTNARLDELSDGTKKSSRKQSVSRATQATEPPKEQETPNNPGIIASLQKILDDAKSATLDRSALKQIDDLLFDIRVEAHEALRRNTG